MRAPWHRRPAEDIDPHRPHEYRAKSDSGIGALIQTGGGMGRSVAHLASTGAYTRTIGCAVPGCGRSPEDLIHAPED